MAPLAELGVLLPLGAGAWFAYFRLKERRCDGVFSLRLAAIVGGCLSTALALAAYSLFDSIGLEVKWSNLDELPFSSALLIGLVEETAKLAPVLLIMMLSAKVRRPLESLMLAACAGLGFASAEGAMLALDGGFSFAEGLARATTAPLTHALLAAPWGLGLGQAVLRHRARGLAIGFAISVFAHAGYDWLLALPHAPPVIALPVVLPLWAWLYWRTLPKAAREAWLERVIARGRLLATSAVLFR